jgi:hypothetical protein
MAIPNRTGSSYIFILEDFFKARLRAKGQVSKCKSLHFWFTYKRICLIFECGIVFSKNVFFPEKYVYFANLRNARDLGTWAVFPCVYVAGLAPWTNEL